MGRNLLRRFLLIAACSTVAVTSILPAPTAAISDDLTVTSSIDWHRGVVEISIRAEIPHRLRERPDGGFRVEREIDQAISAILHDILGDIPLDTYRTIRDAAFENSEINTALTNIARAPRKIASHRTPDLLAVEARYSVNIFPEIAEIFVRHSTSGPLDRVIGWVPTREFTGIVIYAQGEYPIHGRPADQRSAIVPTLFPRVHDESMRVILDREIMEPERVRSWGVVGYADSTDEAAYVDRIGGVPLRILAVRSFGERPSDIVIPLDAAERILSSAANRRLLREGRVVVVIDDTTTKIDTTSYQGTKK